MVLCRELGGSRSLDRHEDAPELLIKGVAFELAGIIASHGGPVLVDDGIGIGAGGLLNPRALIGGKAVGQTVDVDDGVGLGVGVQVRCAEVDPDGVEHKAEDDGVGGAKDAELPAYDVVVFYALVARPKPLEKPEEEQRASDDEDDAENVL